MRSTHLFKALAVAAGVAGLLTGPVAAAAPVCGVWTREPSPSPGTYENYLAAVDTANDSLAWAVGYSSNVNASRLPLALRWNGSLWATESLPSTSSLGSNPTLYSVAITPGQHVWMGGTVSAGTSTSPLMLRRRNGAWDYVNTPTLRRNPSSALPRTGSVSDVTAISDDQVWAVGNASALDTTASTLGLALRWNGTSWTDVNVPIAGSRINRLEGVSGTGPNDVWAVGYSSNVNSAFFSTIYHWNGTAWTQFNHPGKTLYQSYLYDVVALAPNDVWAVGSSSSDGALLLHWDGSTWTRVTAPTPYGYSAVTAMASDDIWVPYSSDYVHWDGSTWSTAPAPLIPGATSTNRTGGIARFGACGAWAVGTVWFDNTAQTLIERLGPALAY